jgi:hypothetical protein
LDGVTSAIQTQLNAKAPSTSGTSILSGNGSGAFTNVTIGTGLDFTGGTLSATGGGGGGSGTVTSVDMSVPTGLAIGGNPITTSGTLALTYASGYAIPTTAKQTEWDTSFTDRLKWDGGATGLTASTGRTSLGATTLGGNLFTITNPSAIRFPRFNADNTVSSLSDSDFRTAIGAGTGNGTVTSIIAGTGLSGGTITSSGTIAIDSTVATLTGTQTLTNKRVTNRIGSNGGTTSGNITPTSDTADQYNITGLTGTSAIQIPSGTPTDGQRLSIRIKDDGTGRTLSWVTTAGGYRVIGTTLPLTTTANKTIYVGCVYNVADSFWDVVAVAEQA